MKVFGFSFVTLLLFLAFFTLGTRHPGFIPGIRAKLGM